LPSREWDVRPTLRGHGVIEPRGVPASTHAVSSRVRAAPARSAGPDLLGAPQLESAGFLLQFREPDWHQHRFLKAYDPVVQVHAFAEGSEEAERMLWFRDRLRCDDGDRALYEETKRRLAARNWERVQDYADAKSEVVQAIIARARTGRV